MASTAGKRVSTAAVSLPPLAPGRGSKSPPRTADSQIPALRRHSVTTTTGGATPAGPLGLQNTTATAAAASHDPDDHAAVMDEAKRRCYDYVFKQRVITRGLIRMIVYAKYGPGVRQPDGSVALTGAHRVLHPFEEKQLLADEADTLLTDIYGGTMSSTSLVGTRAAVDDESRAAMNRNKNKLALDALELTRVELQQVLANADGLIGANSNTRSVDGSGLKATVKARQRALAEAARSAKSTPTADMGTGPSPAMGASTTAGGGGAAAKDRFPAAVEDAISTALLAERRRRIATLKRSEPQRTDIRTDADVTQRATRLFYNKTAPKAYRLRSFEDPKDVLRSLHRHASAIVDPADRNNVAMTLNVRCLRADFEPDPNRPGWDGYCCTRQQHATKITTLR